MALGREYARQGLDWEAELRQIAKEHRLMDNLGIAPPGQEAPVGPEVQDDDQDT